MFHGYGLNFSTVPLYDHRICGGKKFSGELFNKGSSGVGSSIKCSLPTGSMGIEGCIERIREKLSVNGVVEVSPSSYDTAWVAMVPSREYPGSSSSKPCFPQCLDWIMENQNPDGSWGLKHTSLVKDSLSCTLASLLALRKWSVGEKLVQKGLEYIVSNEWAIRDKNQISPIGFDIIFPSMIRSARGIGFMFPDSMTHNPNHKFESVPGVDFNGTNHNLGYVAEGFGQFCNWEELLTLQRSNGSLFNSPATTAAALIHCHNDNCFDYLLSVLDIHKRWVPTIHPMDLCTRLYTVDTLERLGVHLYFQHEIDSILDETYRCWQQKNEEIFTDIRCFALAFRLLRMKGYEVSSDELEAFTKEDNFFSMTSIQFTGIPTILELYRASQLTIYDAETTLEKTQSWTGNFLKKQLLNHTILDNKLHKQVESALDSFNRTLDRVENRRTIELYDINSYHMLKTAYRCPTIDNEDFLWLAKENFVICQAQYQKEMQLLQRWYKDRKFESLQSARNSWQICYFLAAAVLVDPKMSESRISFAQTALLVTLIDDFFDKYGSRRELLDFIELVKNWDEKPAIDHCSEELQIIYSALYNNIDELAAKAVKLQGQDRCIKAFLFSMWHDLLKSGLREVDWSSEAITPNMEEYLSNACVSIASRVCVLTPLHVLGPKLSEESVTSAECLSLCHHVSLISRLLNDIRTFKREQAERSVNSVSLLVAKNEGRVTIEEDEAIAKIRDMVEFSKRKLLQLVIQRKGSLLPRECKNFFWNTGKMAYYLYQRSDEFSSPHEIKTDINAVLYQPLHL